MAAGASPRDRMAGPAYWPKAGTTITSVSSARAGFNQVPPLEPSGNSKSDAAVHGVSSRRLPGTGCRVLRLLRAAGEQHGFHRVKDDVRIQAEGHILDVVKIVFELCDGVFQSIAVLVVDLRPAGDAGADAMALAVVRNLFGEGMDEFGPLRPRTHDGHVADQTVDQLG